MTLPCEAHCEVCRTPGELLAASSDLSSFINYFRCPTCGLVWTDPKLGFSGRRQIITVHDQSPLPRFNGGSTDSSS